MADMTPSEISRLEKALQKLFQSSVISVRPPARKGLSVEIAAGREVIGTVCKDDEDGGASFDINLIILEEDLPPV